MSNNPRWWNRWTVAGMVILGVLGLALLAWDVVRILLEVRAMR